MSTWIGLDVECKDNRWKAVNQLTDEDDPPHITLAYLGKPDLDVLRRARLCEVVGTWLLSEGRGLPVNYQVRNPRYASFGGGHVTVLTIEEKEAGLLARRHELVDALIWSAFYVDERYEFTPHITVGHGVYIYSDILGMSFRVGGLFVQYNGNRIFERKFL